MHYNLAAERPPSSMETKMTTNPTKARRTVMLEVQTIGTKPSHPESAACIDSLTVAEIYMLADNGIEVKETSFSGMAEANLLREFWESVQLNDLFFGYGIDDRLALLRRRTWALNLVPSRDLDLRTVYGHESIDTAILRSGTGGAGYRSAQALASVLGLARTSKPESVLFVTLTELTPKPTSRPA